MINNRLQQLFFFISALAFSSVSSSSTQKIEECPRGSLSNRFCDRDGDLLADVPTDESKWIDPYTLVFGTAPTQSFIFKKGAKESLIRHLEKVTGKKVKFFPYQTNAAQIEAMRTGMLHITGLNTGSVPSAINCTGFRLFAMTAKKDDTYGYKMELITYPGSGINKIADLKDQMVLFVTPSSNSGFKAPVALLKQRFKLIDGVDYDSRFTGRHDTSIYEIANKKYAVAAIANGIRDSMISKGDISKNAVKVIYSSESFPPTGYGYAHNLNPKLAKKIEEAFLTFKWQDTLDGPAKQFNRYKEVKFIPADYINKWEIIRAIDKANDVSYDCQ